MRSGWHVVDFPNAEGVDESQSTIRAAISPASDLHPIFSDQQHRNEDLHVPLDDRRAYIPRMGAATSSELTLFEPTSDLSDLSEGSEKSKDTDPEHNGLTPGSPELLRMIQLALYTDLHSPLDPAQQSAVHVDGVRQRHESSNSSNVDQASIRPGLGHYTHRLTSSSTGIENHATMAGRGFWRALRILSERRMAVLGLRTEVRDARANLRYHRESLRKRDELFIRELQKTDYSNLLMQKDLLSSLHATVQADRERFLELESDFSVLEQQLDREEWDLKMLETKVYDKMITKHEAELGGFSGALSLPSDPFSEVEPSVIHEADYQTILENRYLSRKGDVDILEEELQTLRAGRAAFIEEQRMRERLGLRLSDEGLEFLEAFDNRHNDLRTCLLRAQEDLYHLKDAANGQDDLLFNATQFEDVPAQFPDTAEDEVLGDPNTEELHPILDRKVSMMKLLQDVTVENFQPLLTLGPQTPTFDEVGKDISTAVINMPSFINEWLLHITQQSILWVYVLWTTLDEVMSNMLTKLNLSYSAERLTDLILEYWLHDGTVGRSRLAQEAKSQDESTSSEAGAAQDTVHSCRSDSAIIRKDRLRLRFHGVNHPGHNVQSSLMLDKASRFSQISRGWKPMFHDSAISV